MVNTNLPLYELDISNLIITHTDARLTVIVAVITNDAVISWQI